MNKYLLTIFLFVFISLQCSQRKPSVSDPDELVQQVEALEAHYDSVYIFLAGCYDPDWGGFYERIGAPGTPKLESTARALRLLEWGAVFDNLPDTIKKKQAAFFQNLQNPETGFFEDPQEKRKAENRRGRALSYSTRSLKMLGAEPLYPLPTVKAKVGVEHIQSAAAFVSWMEQLDWNKPWGSCAAISSQPTLIKNQPDSLQQAIVSAAFEWLEQEQNAQTGWWGSQTPYHELSGAFKLGLFYKHFDHEMPNPDKIYNSLLKTLREEEFHDGCWARNALELFSIVKPGFENISLEDKKDIVEISIRNILQLKRNDGGFARNIHQKYSVTDGCSQAMKTRIFLRSLVGLEDKPFPRGELFFENIVE